MLGAVIHWRWAASTLRCVGQFFTAFKGVVNVLQEDPKAKALVDQVLTTVFITRGVVLRDVLLELSSVEYKGQRIDCTFARVIEVFAAINRMDGDPKTGSYAKEMTEAVAQVRGGPIFQGFAMKGTSTSTCSRAHLAAGYHP